MNAVQALKLVGFWKTVPTGGFRVRIRMNAVQALKLALADRRYGGGHSYIVRIRMNAVQALKLPPLWRRLQLHLRRLESA